MLRHFALFFSQFRIAVQQILDFLALISVVKKTELKILSKLRKAHGFVPVAKSSQLSERAHITRNEETHGNIKRFGFVHIPGSSGKLCQKVR